LGGSCKNVIDVAGWAKRHRRRAVEPANDRNYLGNHRIAAVVLVDVGWRRTCNQRGRGQKPERH